MLIDFQNAKPFPHVVIDDYWHADKLREVIAALPPKESPIWKRYQKQKRGCREISLLGPVVRKFFQTFTAPNIVESIEQLTGVNQLIPDTTYAGAGLHAVSRGGSLGVHVDFNELKKIKGVIEEPVYRRLNTFLYLNEDWREEWGGGLTLYEPRVDDRPGKAVKTIAPVFNRLVIFESSDVSWHGHPEPLRCPEGRERLSLACYWYTREKPPWFSETHSTLYVK